MNEPPLLLVCMGVSGSGKSTVAAALSQLYNFELLEADDFHSQESKAHMAAGYGLTDAMREPWMNALCEALEQKKECNQNCVLAFSGLRRAHRQRLRDLGFWPQFLLLEASAEAISARMQARNNHFMPVSLLNSQLSDFQNTALETDVINISVAGDLRQTLSRITAVVDQLLLNRNEIQN